MYFSGPDAVSMEWIDLIMMNSIYYISRVTLLFLLSLVVLFMLGSRNDLLKAAEDQDDKIENNINIENWTFHPEIIKIRNIYNAINSDIAGNKITLIKKSYDIKSDKCGPHVHKVSETIGHDHLQVVRYYKEEKFMSPTSIGEIEHYLDENGVTRFIFKKYDQRYSTRVYFDYSGNPIFSIDNVDGKFMKDRVNLIKYNSPSSETLREIYEMKKECPVLNETTEIGVRKLEQDLAEAHQWR